MKGLRFRLRSIVASIAACLLTAGLLPQSAGAAVSDYGIASTSASLSTSQAGAHPDTILRIDLKRDPETEVAFAGTRDLSVELPPGLVARTNAFPVCPVSQFVDSTGLAGGEASPCPVDSQIGIIKLGVFRGGTIEANAVLNEPLYNLPPPEGAPARLGFAAGYLPTFLELVPRAGDGYGFTARIRGAPDLFVLNSAEAIIWGIPADPVHDDARLTPHEARICGYPCEAPNGQSRPSGLGPLPLMTNPTTCGPQRVGFAVTSYSLPGRVFQESASLPPITGCDRLAFAPTVTMSPPAAPAESPVGVEVSTQLSGEGLDHADTLAPAAIKSVRATLPEGVTLNSAAASGLASCPEDGIGLVAGQPPRFDANPPSCPSASRIGTAKIESPVLGQPLEGSLFLASPRDNPFGSLVAVYLYAEGDGMNVKLAGRLDLDRQTGSLSVSFDELPQQPISRVEIAFKGGSHGLLTSPGACGTYASRISLTSWSGQVQSSVPPLQVGTGPFGESCGPRPFSPRFLAGTTLPIAGAASGFVATIVRAPGEQSLSSFDVTLPDGLLPDIGSVTTCAWAARASCPPSSEIGHASILSGSGPAPVRLPEIGKPPAPIFLGGPYRGAPLSLVIGLAVEAGPFDLEPQWIRVALFVNPRTTQVTARSDPLPQLVEGIPTAYRELRLELNPASMRNPTSCDPGHIDAHVASVEGARADVATHFQVGSCDGLPLRPRVGVQLRGNHDRNGRPELRVVLRGRPREAAISHISALVPRTELLDGARIAGVCSRPEFAEGRCPHNSTYGHAQLTTPLLGRPLRGPIYLRASRHRLPDLVAVLDGAIKLDLVARVDAVHKQLRVTFGRVPDAPMTRFALTLDGGSKGFLVNTVDLCRTRSRVGVQIGAHNGRRQTLHPLVDVRCRGGGRR